MKTLENSPKIAQMESRLAKYTYLSRNNLPGYLDGVVFQSLTAAAKYPDRATNPHLYHWYILMRQFAPNTITRWVDDRLYFDPDDALLAMEPPAKVRLMRKVGSGEAGREEAVLQPKSPKQESGEMEYVIDILMKEWSEEGLEQLRRCLEDYRVTIIGSSATREVRVKCGSESARRQEITNLIERAVEYENLQVKREKKTKTSPRQEPPRQ